MSRCRGPERSYIVIVHARHPARCPVALLQGRRRALVVVVQLHEGVHGVVVFCVALAVEVLED